MRSDEMSTSALSAFYYVLYILLATATETKETKGKENIGVSL